MEYRPLSQITVPDSYPMPRADDFDSSGQARSFSVLDLKSDFHQIPVRDGDIPKTAFSIPICVFEYTKIPFGLRGAPANFQRAIDQTLSPYLCTFARVYLDDVLVYSENLQQHLQHLDCVSGSLERDGLHANPAECQFAIEECKCLGQTVDADGIRPCPSKLGTIQKMPSPRKAAELCLLLWLLGYCRRFEKNLLQHSFTAQRAAAD